MSEQIVECVPNFSEGRDPSKIKQITDAIEAVAGVTLLDVDRGADTNRTVVTFLGPPEAVLEAAYRGVQTAAQVIDMSGHHGAHPRMGATDVCPFVPVEGLSLEDCAELARRLGRRVGEELGIPVYLYEAAASTPARRNLATVRKGEYEGLAAKLADPVWAPDFGPAEFRPATGALITGAREFLIAYNVTLNTRNKALASDIALELRETGRVARASNPSPVYSRGAVRVYADGEFPCGNCGFVGTTLDETAAHAKGSHAYDLRALLAANGVPSDDPVGHKVYRAGIFSHCKAIGWYVEEYDRAQISVNLTDYHVTPPHLVLEEARRLADDRGLVVTGSEIVGLVPFQAMAEAGEWYLRRQGKTPGVPVVDLLRTAVHSMGLEDVAPFVLESKVLGLPTHAVGSFATLSVADLVDEISRDTPAPGGGSVAALAGSIGAALASMVAALTQGRTGEPGREELLTTVSVEAQRVKDALLRTVDADADAFLDYMEARRLPATTDAERGAREEAMQAGLRMAIEVPLETARHSLAAMRLADTVTRQGNPASLSDGAVGVQMGFAGVRGGAWNARINLKGVTDPAFVAATRDECDRLLAEARDLLVGNETYADEHLG